MVTSLFKWVPIVDELILLKMFFQKLSHIQLFICTVCCLSLCRYIFLNNIFLFILFSPFIFFHSFIHSFTDLSIYRVPRVWTLTMTTVSTLLTQGIGHKTSLEMLVSVCLCVCVCVHACYFKYIQYAYVRVYDLGVFCVLGLADRFEEYPKLRELIRLKDELISTTNTPPMYVKSWCEC